MKKNIKSQRQLRIAEQLKHLISEIITLGNFRNKKIRTIPITVTEVNISPDLKKANIFVISRDNKKSFIKYLNEENFIFKKYLGLGNLIYLKKKLLKSFNLDLFLN